MKKNNSQFICICVIVFISISYVSKTYAQKNKKAKSSDTISIVAVGDMMLGSAYPTKKDLPANPNQSFSAVKQFLKGDIVFGNLEGCFLDDGKSEKCRGIDPNRCYAFRMPTKYVSIFKDAGFNLLSIANNHIGDFEEAGRTRTAELLDSAGIYYAGLLTKPYDIFEINGVKYGFIAFAPNQLTVPLNDYDKAKELIAKVRPLVNILIISFHGGGEGSKYQHVPKKREIFLKENRGNVHQFAHMVIDNGADIVLGHGPHVTRAVEVYKNKFIAYSLGNFSTYAKFNLDGANGIAPLLNIKLDTKGNFIYADVVSIKQTKLKPPLVDTKNAAFYKMKYLTNTNFPKNKLLFTNQRIKLK